MMNNEIKRAVQALRFLIPILERYHFQWVITGGFACFVYGVDRQMTDIDIDINTSKDSASFQKFLFDIQTYTSQPLSHFVDQNYDNYNLEITYGGQLIDICPIAELKIFDTHTKTYKPFDFYRPTFPTVELVQFHGLTLPLLPKRFIIENKEMLVWQRDSDRTDIAGLRKLISHSSS